MSESSGVGKLPESWCWVRLKDVLSEPLVNGRSVKTMGGGFPVLRLTAIAAGHIDLRESKDGAWTADEAEPFLVQEGDFLISRGNGSRRLVGRGGLVAAVISPVAFPDTMIRARLLREMISPAYFRILWDSPLVRRQIEAKARTTAGIYKVNQAILEEVVLPLPPLAEQHRIVEALEEQLSRLDAATRSAVGAVARIERLSMALLDAELAPFVERVRLADVLSSPLINGRSVKTMEGGFPVLRLTAIQGERIDLGECKPGAWDADDARAYVVEKGDFLVSRGNGSLNLVARGGLVGDVTSPVAFPDTMIRVRPDVAAVVPEFLAMVWGTTGVRRQIESRARTTAGIYKVNQEIIEAIEFPLPPVERQAEIVARQRNHGAVIQAARVTAETAVRRGSNLRNALLRKAFEGSLVPQNEADEPAADVLARIAAERVAQPKPRRMRKGPAKKSAAPAQRTMDVAAPEPTPILAVQQEFDL